MSDSPSGIDYTSQLHAGVPFSSFLGIERVVGSAEEITAQLPWDGAHATDVGTLHGGASMGLADVLGGLMAFVNLPAGASRTTTISSMTNFFRPGRGELTRAVCRPLHVGSTTIVVQTDLYDSSAALIGRVTQTQAVLRPRRHEPEPDQESGLSIVDQVVDKP